MINARLNELLSINSCAHWLALFEAQRIPCAPVNSLSQALADTQVLHRNMVVDLKHPNGGSTKGPGNPIKLSRSSDEVFTAAPTLGQHTDEVMTQLLNLSVEQIQQMKDQGIIK
jgi:crotonobetainyl-CoA:carnitine CoA-transferase CaiB-like acyl-CoA transferase